MVEKNGGRAGGAAGKGPERGRRSRGAGLAQEAMKIRQILARAAWKAYREHDGVRDKEPHAFNLDLHLTVRPGGRWDVDGEPPLAEQIRAAVAEAAARGEVFRPGRVYCYRCESSACPHGVPPGPQAVFGGYSPTGLPQWLELVQIMLDLRHSRLERLYEPSEGELVAAAMDAESLKGHQLEVFGRRSRTYNVLAQTVFGYMKLHQAGTPERVAFTLQAVEVRGSGGAPSLRLNVIGRLGDGSSAAESLKTPFQLKVLSVMHRTRQLVENLYRPAPGAGVGADLPPGVVAGALRIMSGTARILERLGRQAGRRTLHAEKRGVANRPTAKALDDAASAADGRVLWDERRRTVVVIGPRQRVHVFTHEGKHVTSLQLDTEAVKKRRKKERWERLPPGLLESFRAAVRRAAGKVQPL